MPLTIYGKRMVGRMMYNRGKQFCAASVLLHEKIGDQYVVFHLLLQGIECILKGILIHYNYDKYFKKIKGNKRFVAKEFGHDIQMLISEVGNLYKIKRIKDSTIIPLKQLCKMYIENELRYADVKDIYIDPRLLDTGTILDTINQVVYLCDKRLFK